MNECCQKLVLGTAQFGLAYGITNPANSAVSSGDVKQILDICREHSIEQLDTAVTYGDSEAVLGALNVSDFLVDTKIPLIEESTRDTVIGHVEASLTKLGVTSLHAVYFHDVSAIHQSSFSSQYAQLQELKQAGIIQNIGVSVYAPSDLEMILSRFTPDIVQAPFNLFDNRIIASGWGGRLNQSGIQLYSRSAFLQGLLLAENIEQFPKGWQEYLGTYQSWCRDQGVSALEACLHHCFSEEQVSRVVLGVHSLSQFTEILTALDRIKNIGFETPDFQVPDTLYDPRKW